MNTESPDNILELTRHFAGPPAAIWTVWTQPDLIARWFGSSHGFRAGEVRVDLRPGGRWSLRNVKGDKVEHVTGTYHEVVPERRLCYTYHYEGTEFFSVVSVDFNADGDGTRADFRQTGFPDHGSWHGHSLGWPYALKLMAEALILAVGAGKAFPPNGRVDGVTADLEAARARLEAEGKATNAWPVQ